MSRTARENSRGDEHLSVSSMALAAGLLLVIAGVLTLLAIALPTPPDVRREVILASGAFGVIGGGLEIGLRRRLALWHVYAFYGLGFVSVLGSALWSHRHADALDTLPAEVMSLWLGVFAMYCFPRRAAAVALAAIAIMDVTLAVVGGAPLPAAVWVFVVPSFLVLLIVVRLLRERTSLLLSAVSEMARTDPLTGLANRRRFLERLDEELVRVKRYGGDFSLLFADLDHFKEINDRHGHDAGDRALQTAASAFSSCIRDSDLVGRLGGEEFAVLLVEAGPPTADMVAARIQSQLAEASASLGFTLSASIGVAPYWDAASPKAMLQAADTAVYAAKEQGRNRVAVAAAVT